MVSPNSVFVFYPEMFRTIAPRRKPVHCRASSPKDFVRLARVIPSPCESPRRASRRGRTGECRGVGDDSVARRLVRNQRRNQEVERGEHREGGRRLQARLDRRSGKIRSLSISILWSRDWPNGSDDGFKDNLDWEEGKGRGDYCFFITRRNSDFIPSGFLFLRFRNSCRFLILSS